VSKTCYGKRTDCSYLRKNLGPEKTGGFFGVRKKRGTDASLRKGKKEAYFPRSGKKSLISLQVLQGGGGRRKRMETSRRKEGKVL